MTSGSHPDVKLTQVDWLTDPDQDTPTARYHLYDRNAELLYIGASRDPERRMRSHACQSRWYVLADPSLTTVEWFPTVRDGLFAEAIAIATEAPLFNYEHIPDKRVAQLRLIEYLRDIERLDLTPRNIKHAIWTGRLVVDVEIPGASVAATDRATLLRRLAAGEQLAATEVAAVLRVSLRTVQNLVNDGRLRSRIHGGGKLRIIDMTSVRERLVALGEVLPPPSKSPEPSPGGAAGDDSGGA